MAWRSCGPEILNPALFHELKAEKAMTCRSSVLISGGPYLPHDASSPWAPKDPGNGPKTCVFRPNCKRDRVNFVLFRTGRENNENIYLSLTKDHNNIFYISWYIILHFQGLLSQLDSGYHYVLLHTMIKIIDSSSPLKTEDELIKD